MDIPVLDEHPLQEAGEMQTDHITSSQKVEAEQKKEPRAFDSSDQDLSQIELFDFKYYARPIASWNPNCNLDPETSIDKVFDEMVYTISRNDKLAADAIIMENKVGLKVYAAFFVLLLAVINFYILLVQEFQLLPTVQERYEKAIAVFIINIVTILLVIYITIETADITEQVEKFNALLN